MKKTALVLTFLIGLIIAYSAQHTSFLNPISVSAVDVSGFVGVYWDKACVNRVSSIDWGTLTPGSSKDVLIYVRNEGSNTSFVNLKPTNWNPYKASKYIKFSCNSSFAKPGERVRFALILHASWSISGIDVFSFNIIFDASKRFPPWDVNQNGVVDITDLAWVENCFGTHQGDERWFPSMDVNSDGAVDIIDVGIVTAHVWEFYL